MRVLFILLTSLYTLYAKTIKVSYNPNYPLYFFEENNKAKGFLVDIWREWGKVANVDIKFVKGKNWNNAIQLLKEKKVDFFIATSPYEKWMIPAKQIFYSKAMLFKLKNSHKKIDKIAIIGDNYLDVVKDLYPKAKIITIKQGDEYKIAIEKLKNKEIDGIFEEKLGFLYYLMQNSINNIVVDNSKKYIEKIYPITYSKEKANFFNKYFEQIDTSTLQAIENKWIKSEEDKFYRYKIKINLTKEEKNFLKNHKVITVAMMSYWDDDTHKHLVELLKKVSNLNFKVIYFNKWKDGFDAVKSGKVDMIMNLSYSKEREKYFFYTKVYKSYPLYVLKKRNSSNIKYVIVKNKTITEKVASELYKNLKLKKVNDLSTLYEAIDKHSIGLTYFINYKLLRDFDLEVDNIIINKYGNVYIGVTRKEATLYSIINKILNSIPQEQLNKISSFKIKIEKKEEIKNNYLIITIFTIFIVSTIIFFIYLLTRIELLSNISFRKLVITIFITEIIYIILFISTINKTRDFYIDLIESQKEMVLINNNLKNLTIDIDTLNLLSKIERKLLNIYIKNSNKFILDNLLTLVNNRIKNRIENLNKNILLYNYIIIGAGISFIFLNIILFLIFRKKLLKPLDYLKELIINFNKGIQTNNKVYFKDEVGEIIENFIKMSNKIKEKEKIIISYNKRIIHSLEFASSIQKSIIGDKQILDKYFNNTILWRQKDIVGGDVYFIEKIDNKIIIMAFDCTGHGVYGAFITILVSVLKDEILYHKKITSANKILEMFNENIKIKMNQIDKSAKSNVGFDGAVIVYDINEDTFEYSGARMDLILVKNSHLDTIKSNRKTIGNKRNKLKESFKSHKFRLEKGDRVFVFSDGVVDQLNKENKSFGKRRLFNILLNYPIDTIDSILIEKIELFKQDNEYTDDILLIGIEK